MMPSLICKVCKQDHNNMNRKWCDRSDLEIMYDKNFSDLEEAVKCLREILEQGNIAVQGKWDATDKMKNIAFRFLSKWSVDGISF